jgi:membrane protein
MRSDTDVIENLDFGRSGGSQPPPRRGFRFYVRGTWLFCKRMWPALYNLSTSETYVYASAIAFNMLISFFPFIVLIGSVLVNVLGWQHAYQTIYRLMIAMVPVDAGVLFRSLDQVTRGPTGKAGVLSFALLALSSSGIFLPIELALNRAYGFEKPRGAIKQYLIYTILVVVAGVVVTSAASLASYFDTIFGLTAGGGRARQYLFNVMGLATALPFIFILFFLIYYVVPHGKVEARQIFFTSAATTILVLMATFIFRVSLPLLDLRTTYLDVYRVMALVLWVFILSFILILGANLSAYQVLPRSWTGKQPHE